MSWAGFAFFMRMAKYREAGPPPRQVILRPDALRIEIPRAAMALHLFTRKISARKPSRKERPGPEDRTAENRRKSVRRPPSRWAGGAGPSAEGIQVIADDAQQLHQLVAPLGRQDRQDLVCPVLMGRRHGGEKLRALGGEDDTAHAAIRGVLLAGDET